MEKETVINEEHIVSVGRKLANLRLKLGLTESDIARQIHVRTTIIQDLENDRQINVPAVFLKGYIKNYALLVSLPQDEYQSYLDSLETKSSIQVMRNYSNKEQKKRNSKRLILTSLFIILVIIGVISFFAWKENKSELVEVTHYISQPVSTDS